MSKKAWLENLDLDEVSLVDRGMNEPSKIVLYKRDSFGALAEAVIKSYAEPKESFRAALADMLEEEKAYEKREKMYPLMDALRESVTAIASQRSGEDFERGVREQVEEFMLSLRDLDLANDEEEVENREHDDKAGLSGNTSEETEDEMDLKELEKRLDDLEQENASFKAQNDALTKALADNGFTVSGEGEEITVEKRDDSDDYIEVEGEMVLKSAVPAPLLKKLERTEGEVAELRKERDQKAIEKRASEELPNLTGEVSVKADIIKALDGIEDEESREAAFGILKAADEATHALLIEKGRAPGSHDADSPEAKIEALAKRYYEEGKYPDLVTARAEVTTSPEGRAIRSQGRTAH